MTTIDPTKPLGFDSEQQLNNKSEKPLRGFNTHPENINKRGAPKKEWTVQQLYREALEETLEIKNRLGEVTQRGKAKDLMVRQIIRKAVYKGDVSAAREITNRLDGMPLQATDITSMGEKLTIPHITIDTKPKENNE